MKTRFVLSTVFLVVVLLATSCGQRVPSAPIVATEEAPSAPIFETQTSNAGQVVVDVTPLNLGTAAETWEFEVALNTHSVNLDYDLMAVAVLRDDRGNEYLPISWNGSPPGGHHRRGVLSFAALPEPGAFVEVVIREVAGVPERVFHWELSASGEAPADERAASKPGGWMGGPYGEGEGYCHDEGEGHHHGGG